MPDKDADIIPIIRALPYAVKCPICADAMGIEDAWVGSWDGVHPVEHCTVDEHGYVILCPGSYK